MKTTKSQLQCVILLSQTVNVSEQAWSLHLESLKAQIDEAVLIDIATGIELMHTYSLIHDDLPAMDDDDMRRGQPSNHIEFNEATAILAGDALQASGV